VRHDIRRSFGSSRTLANGVPLRVNLTVTDASEEYIEYLPERSQCQR
jgi:hypothetical protein